MLSNMASSVHVDLTASALFQVVSVNLQQPLVCTCVYAVSMPATTLTKRLGREC